MNSTPHLTAAQRKVLTELARFGYVPVRGGRTHGAAVRCTPATALVLHNLGLVEATETLRYREGRERMTITRVKITDAGLALVEGEKT